MQRFNVCLIRPEKYIHSLAFLELGELIYFSALDLGFNASIGFNSIEPNGINLVIGCHLLDPEYIEKFPKSTIVLNTEQIYADEADWNKNIFAWARRFKVWDYSERNIEKFKSLSIADPVLLNIGFQKELVRLDRSITKDVDVLFYGVVSPRRRKILDELVDLDLKVKVLFGVYGKDRDSWVQRSKLILNHHFYKSEIFEIVRVFYLMTNSIAVVGEVNDSTSINDMCRAGVYTQKYENLSAACLELSKDTDLRRSVESKAFDSISRHPQRIFTEQSLDFTLGV
jgi:hypothetical protein